MRFQSPRLATHILKHPKFLETPVHQQVAVVFLDLSGFTGVAEALGPEWVRELLAEFQARVEREVEAQGGFVLSPMGDGEMIVFGLPEPQPDDAARALSTIPGTRVYARNGDDGVYFLHIYVYFSQRMMDDPPLAIASLKNTGEMGSPKCTSVVTWSFFICETAVVSWVWAVVMSDW